MTLSGAKMVNAEEAFSGLDGVVAVLWSEDEVD
jgi:hypothetical protein